MTILSTDHLRRCLTTLSLSIQCYQSAALDSGYRDVFSNAIIKGYELAQEVSFKLIRKILRIYFDVSGRKLQDLPVREILRIAGDHGLIAPDRIEHWFTYRANRNHTAHDYGEAFVTETLRLLPGFVQDATDLADHIDELTRTYGDD